MGLIRAFGGAVGGALADQWKDFITVPSNVGPTAAIFPSVLMGTNAGRGTNTGSSRAVISNGSKIVVPEGYGLLTFQDGSITSFVNEPGGYIWNSEDINSQTVFAGDGFQTSVVKESWERFKLGGRPTSQQLALIVCLKELPNNKFGTQSEIYWDDAFLNTQVGAVARGTYTLQIVDPILFVKNFLPATFLQTPTIFDFTDPSNPSATQIFSEVVASLAAAFSAYVNSSPSGARISQLQTDSVGFAQSLAHTIESNYGWEESRGLTITRVALVAIEYDEGTRALIKTIQRADALAGSRGNSNLQASVAAGIEAAGESGGSAGLIGLGIASNTLGVAGLQQSQASTPSTATGNDALLARLRTLRQALDEGLISEMDYETARTKALDG